MVLALCESSYNQGVYGLVTNLGSLVVRTIFFPVEEAAFRAFSSPSGWLAHHLLFLVLLTGWYPNTDFVGPPVSAHV